MKTWNPWNGCHRYSEGCRHCVHQRTVRKHGVEELIIEKSKQYTAPVERNKNTSYRIQSGETVLVSFNSDFFLKEADRWRKDCWNMIRERSDVTFVLRVRRIERFYDCIPDDWMMGYDNVVIACAVENQKIADEKLSILKELPVKRRAVLCQPLQELIDIEQYLPDVETVMVEGEYGKKGTVLDYEWLPDIRWQCINTNTVFILNRCGTNFLKDGKKYAFNARDQKSHAKKLNINYYPEVGDASTIQA